VKSKLQSRQKWATLLLLSGCSLTLGSTSTWQETPGTPDDWFDATAWNGGVPTSSSVAYINNGGTATISHGYAQTSSLYLAQTNDVSGYVNMSNGQLFCGSAMYIGNSQYSVGTFTQSGGTVTIDGSLSMAVGYTSDVGIYQLSGNGQLTAYNEYLGSGAASSGDSAQFIQTGGSNTIINSGTLFFADGTYSMSGSSTLTVPNFQLSSQTGGVAAFTQSGGTVSVGNALSIGYSGQGSYAMTAGASLTCTSLGVGNASSFSQTDSTVNLGSGYFYVANGSNASASYTLAGSSQLNSGTQYIGYGSAAKASFNQTGGINNLGAAALYLGYEGGNGTYMLSGNSVLNAGGESIGVQGSGILLQSGGANNLGTGTLNITGSYSSYYQLSGGSLQAGTENIYSGAFASFTQSGGINTVAAGAYSAGVLNIGTSGSATSGTYNLSGGTLNAYTENLGTTSTTNTSVFNHTGGTNITGVLTIASDGRYVLQSGSLQVSKTFTNNGVVDLVNPASIGLTGTTTVTVPINITGTGTLLVEPNTLLNSAAITQTNVNVGGEIQIAPGSAVSVFKSLDINSGGTLDITNNGLIIDYTAPNSPLGAVQEYVRTGALSGWTGNGIISSTAAGQTAVAVGFAENSVLGLSTYGGTTVDSSALLVRFTWFGDANLDGKVDSTDLNMIQSNGATWTQGDFNYDGQVNADDYALFDLGLAKSGGSIIALPEPMGLTMLAVPMVLSMNSRKRKIAR
jgi:hypothetical protein